MLQIALQRAARSQIETIEVVKRHSQQIGQARARHADAFVAVYRAQVGLLLPVAVLQFLRERSIVQIAIDQATAGEQANMAVGQRLHVAAPLGEVIGGAALRDHQR